MNTLLRVGMIGVGGFGKYRRERMRETGLFQVAACCDRNPEILQAACAEEQAVAVGTFDELLAQPGLEGIVISTGIDTHAPFAIQAMRAGLHVFVEKPLCGTEAEIRALRAAQAETGRVFNSGHVHLPSNWIFRLVKQTLDEGRLGTVACYEENSSHSGGLEIRPGDWRGQKARNPGGMLLQCGVHSLHRLIHQFGSIDEVMAMMRYDANPNTETADVANVLIRHRSGLVGTLNCYHVTGYQHALRVFGTHGNLYVDTQYRKAWFQPRKRNEIEELQDVAVPADEPLAACQNLVAWHDAIRHGTPPSPSLEDAIAAVAPVFAAERSAEQRMAVSLAQEAFI